MKLDWTGIALIAAILSPVITAVINVVHEHLMYKKRFYTEHRAEVIERYIKAAGAFLSYPSADTMREYGCCFGEVFLYLPPELHKKVSELDKLLAARDNRTAAAALLTEIVTALYKTPPRRR